MDFEIPNRNNWKKGHKLVGIGLSSTRQLNPNSVCLYFMK
jgi:hypothetical protein